MKNENSVAIHIRKGADYLKRNIWDGTCSVEYYNQAINYLKEHVSNPVFICLQIIQSGWKRI